MDAPLRESDRDRHAVRAAPNSWRGRFEEHLRRAQVERTPPKSTLT
jgi:hypothetical protein